MKQFEKLGGCIFVQCLCELVNCWRDFKSLVKDALLPLKPNVFWPFDIPCQVSFRLDISTYGRADNSLKSIKIIITTKGIKKETSYSEL